MFPYPRGTVPLFYLTTLALTCIAFQIWVRRSHPCFPGRFVRSADICALWPHWQWPVYSSGTNTLAQPLSSTPCSVAWTRICAREARGRSGGGATFTADAKADAAPAKPQLGKQARHFLTAHCHSAGVDNDGYQ